MFTQREIRVVQILIGHRSFQWNSVYMHAKQSLLKNGMHLFEYNPELALGKVLHVCLHGLYSIYAICTRHGQIQREDRGSGSPF